MPLPGFGEFLKKNAKFAYGGGVLGAAFVAKDIKGISDADNKFKALLKTLKEFILIRVALAGLFTAVGAAVKSLVRETGSLDQALRRLSQIQVVSRQLQSFVGGLANARKRMAEISELSNRGPFKFEQIAEANKSLEIFTRGAFSSVEATRMMGEVGIATGNSIEDVSRAVGMFYDELSSGNSVTSSLSQLREMGVISKETADHLDAMAAGGQDVATVFGELKGALSSASQEISGYGDELANVTAEHDKAIEALQEKFGAPFTENEIENTKNMTAALQALTPTVGKIGESLATVYNGFSTAKVAITRFVAESKPAQVVMQGVVYVLEAATIAAVAFGTVAAAQITPAILGMGASLVAMGGKARIAMLALRGLSLVGVWGVVGVAIVGVAGAIYNMSQQATKARKEFGEWSKAQLEATSSIMKQIAAIQTLADKNAVLLKSIDEIIKSEKELADVRSKQEEEKQRKDVIQQNTGERPADTQEDKINADKARQLEDKVKTLRSGMDEAIAGSPVNKALVEAEAQRRYGIEEQNKGVVERERQARAGLQARSELESKTATLQSRISEKQTRDEADRLEFAKQRASMGPAEIAVKEKALSQRGSQLTNAMVEKQNAELQAPGFSSVALNAKAEQMRQAQKADMLEAELKQNDDPLKRIDAQRARALSGGVKFDANAKQELETQATMAQRREGEAGQLGEDVRQERIKRNAIETDIKGSEARRRGDIRGAQAMEDLAKFSSRFEDNLSAGFGKDKAASFAKRQTDDEIAQEYQDAQKVVSSMQSVGGGGNFSGVDPMLQSARRREELQARMVDLLGILTGQEPQQSAPPTFQ